MERELLEREAARRSLLAFTKLTKPDYQIGSFHQALAADLEWFEREVAARRSPRLMIMAPPRHGKSELTSRRCPAWMLGRNPDWQIIAASHTAKLAQKMSRDVQRIMDDQRYSRIFPAARLASPAGRASSDSARARTVDLWELAGRRGSYRAVGVGGSVTGEGADVVLIDDPVKGRKDADSKTIRDGIADWYGSDIYTRLEPGGGVVLTTTRWHEDDLAGRLLNAMQVDGDNWRVVRYPAISDSGEALHPERYPLEKLNRIRRAIGERSFASLYQQRPTPDQGGLIEARKIGVVDAAPASRRRVRAWDFAASADGDWTVGALMAAMADGWAIEDVVRFRGAPAEVRATLKATAERDGQAVQIVIPQDPGQAGKDQAQSLAKMLAPRRVTIERPTGSKETRAEPFAAQVGAGNVQMRKAPWNAPLIDELIAFPAGAHDDQVDACASAFNALAGGSYNIEALI